jgi:hypothetical protein
MDIVTRVKNILLSPTTEWPVIAAEPTDAARLYQGYVLPLAAIPPLCTLLGGMLSSLQLGLGFTISTAILGYVMSLLGVFLVGLIIAKLAPRFGGQEDLVQGLKVAAYSSTASWIAGVFHLVPYLGIVGTLLSLYGLYLFYTGLPVLMRTPQSNSLAYTITVIVIAIAVVLCLSLLAAMTGFGYGFSY